MAPFHLPSALMCLHVLKKICFSEIYIFSWLKKTQNFLSLYYLTGVLSTLSLLINYIIRQLEKMTKLYLMYMMTSKLTLK